MSLYSFTKYVLYSLGILGAYHRLRNRRTLTIVMFHRILSQDDPRWPTADSDWTVSNTLFEECLRFFEQHYHVVSLEDVLRASESASRLPERSLLITFDDGWADNEEYGLKLLQKMHLPAVVFAVADAVGRAQLWSETLFQAWRVGRLSPEQCNRLWDAAGAKDGRPARWTEPKSIWALTGRLAALEEAERIHLLSQLADAFSSPGTDQMLSAQQLRTLHAGGVAVGSHGLTHSPIPFATNQKKECCDSRALLAQLLGLPPGQGPVAFSFPHGIYDTSALTVARAAGYRLIFTSDESLNPISHDFLRAGVFGRINIPASAITDLDGHLRPESLGLWLFNRPKQHFSPRRTGIRERSLEGLSSCCP